MGEAGAEDVSEALKSVTGVRSGGNLCRDPEEQGRRQEQGAGDADGDEVPGGGARKDKQGGLPHLLSNNPERTTAELVSPDGATQIQTPEYKRKNQFFLFFLFLSFPLQLVQEDEGA